MARDEKNKAQLWLKMDIRKWKIQHNSTVLEQTLKLLLTDMTTLKGPLKGGTKI
jgi:hypothetical protein